MDTPWRIELLGGLQAVQGDQVVSRFRRQKDGVLLAYLAYHLHRRHPRQELIELLWPGFDPQASRRNLRVALSSLRRQLEPPGILPGTVILADHAAVQLNPAACTTDVAQFEAALRAAKGAGSGTVKVQRLTDAAELYRGELLPAYYEDWVLPERQRLAEAFHQAVEQLVRLLEKQGDFQRALQWARRAVGVDRLREEAHHSLIRLLAAAGQPAAAVQQYRTLERLLDQELGTRPAPEIEALVREIERLGPVGKSTSVGEPARRTRSPRPPVPPMSSPLPAGIVTFLVVEIEGYVVSDPQDEGAQHSMRASSAALLRRLFHTHQGSELRPGAAVEGVGDGAFLVAFGRASDALAAAIAGQQALATQAGPESVAALRARMALQTGDVEFHEGSYHGVVLDGAARLLAAAHDGQILCSEETAALLRRSLKPGIRLVDLGLYRLRDGAPPERLFQVDHPGMALRKFPPPNAARGYVSHLPLQFTRFFGREEEIGRLCELLFSQQTRLVTLTGPGGSGKTRLALEVVSRLQGPFSGAVWFVSLVDLTDARLIPSRIRDELGLDRSPDVEPLEQVVAALSHRPALLLLDNLEHLLAEGTSVVQTLRERAETLTLLVTSRRQLNLPGERVFPVPPLPTPHGPSTPEELIRCASVRLFVDRAQAVRPDFQVTKANAAAVATLCARLEGIPLALELAAARVSVLTPAQMLLHLDDRFDLLVSRRREPDARHQSLRAALDWSYGLLPLELQRFFAQLSVFRGGWTAAAASVVCAVGDEPRALDYLHQLRECSMVLTEEDQDEMRFRMLETLREYAAEQLTADEQAPLARRHAAYYLALVEQVPGDCPGSAEREWLEQLETEHDNLRASLRYLANMGETEDALRLAGALQRFWSTRGHLWEGRARLGELLAAAGAASPSWARARGLAAAGWMACDQGDVESARRLFEESLAGFRALGDAMGTAYALHALGNLLLGLADYQTGRALLEESLFLFRTLDVKGGIADVLRSLGWLAWKQGEHVAGQTLLRENLKILRELDDRTKIAWSLEELGQMALAQGDMEAAQDLYRESLDRFRDLGAKLGIRHCLEGLANLSAMQNQLERASRLLGAAKALREALGQPLSTSKRADYERQAATLRAGLGEVAFAAPWAEGQAMSLDQIVTYASEGILPS